jgi:hypothetical protein
VEDQKMHLHIGRSSTGTAPSTSGPTVGVLWAHNHDGV